MAIQNIGNMNQVLNQYKANEWSKSSKLEGMNSFSIDNGLGQVGEAKGKSFSELLASSIQDVNSMQKEADTAIQKLATGQSKNLHETMLSVEKAEIAFKTMNQIRMKVIDAYKEVMKMQV